ncbi:MAG TPA: hypothetical protein VIV36_07660 [Gaiella sp.]
MTRILVHRPDEPTPPPAAVALAPREHLERPVVGLVSNGKPHAAELLEAVARELHVRLGEGEVELLRKPSAAYAITPAQAREMAARAHLVVTGVGD